jgi:hypothetical protein
MNAPVKEIKEETNLFKIGAHIKYDKSYSLKTWPRFGLEVEDDYLSVRKAHKVSEAVPLHTTHCPEKCEYKNEIHHGEISVCHYSTIQYTGEKPPTCPWEIVNYHNGEAYVIGWGWRIMSNYAYYPSSGPVNDEGDYHSAYATGTREKVLYCKEASPSALKVFIVRVQDVQEIPTESAPLIRYGNKENG